MIVKLQSNNKSLSIYAQHLNNIMLIIVKYTENNSGTI